MERDPRESTGRNRRMGWLLLGVAVGMVLISAAVILIRNDTLARMPVW